jgi:hypothetical protein
MERKSYPLTKKAIEQDGEGWLFTGHAAVFNVADDGDPPDVILPGAFTKTIQEWGPAGANRIKVLALHRYDWLPIGRPLELAEDATGLAFRARISDTAVGRDVATLIADEVVTEMSIGFDRIKWEIDKNAGVWRIKLWEISPVTWAMHPLARIAALKDLFGELCQADDPGLCAAVQSYFQEHPSAKTALLSLLASAEPAPATPPFSLDDPALRQSFASMIEDLKHIVATRRTT